MYGTCGGATWRRLAVFLLSVSVVLIYIFTIIWKNAAVSVLSGYFVFQGALCGVAIGDLIIHQYNDAGAARIIKTLIIMISIMAEVGPTIYIVGILMPISVEDSDPLITQLIHLMYETDTGISILVMQIVVLTALMLAQIVVIILQAVRLCGMGEEYMDYITTILTGCGTLYVFLATSLWTQYASFVYQGTLVLTGVVFGLCVISQMLTYVTTPTADIQLRSAYYTTITAALALFGPVFAVAQIAGAGLTTPDNDDTIINQLAHHMTESTLGATITIAIFSTVLVVGNVFIVIAYAFRASFHNSQAHHSRL